MKYFEQMAPIQSANEDMFILVEWVILERKFVKKGQVICVIETTKAVFDVEASYGGYLFYLLSEDEEGTFGNPLAIISEIDDVNIKTEYFSLIHKSDHANVDVKTKRYTKKALLVAKRHGINIDDVKNSGMIKEADVLDYIKSEKSGKEDEDIVYDRYPDSSIERVTILGAGIGAVQLIDVIMRGSGQRVVGILDDNYSLHRKKMFGIEILGPLSMAQELIKNRLTDSFIISFSNDLHRRAKIFYDLQRKQKVPFTNIIDPTVQIHFSVKIGVGNVILCNSSVGPCTSIGDNNFISAYTNIDHHNILGNNCTFGPGVMTSGEVQIKDKVKFGTGIFIEPAICIGENSIVSSGSIITFDIPENFIVKKHVDVKLHELKRGDIL
jgi:sugar O-acyltransferase (sialic acid O-acetyltransferase NeuD family)